MLASRKKAETLLQRLVEELGDKADLGVIYCPVGLDLGGRAPGDIAVAIVDELFRHDAIGAWVLAEFHFGFFV